MPPAIRISDGFWIITRRTGPVGGIGAGRSAPFVGIISYAGAVAAILVCGAPGKIGVTASVLPLGVGSIAARVGGIEIGFEGIIAKPATTFNSSMVFRLVPGLNVKPVLPLTSNRQRGGTMVAVHLSVGRTIIPFPLEIVHAGTVVGDVPGEGLVGVVPLVLGGVAERDGGGSIVTYIA